MLADRHYSPRTLGAQVGPPGRLLVFILPGPPGVPDRRALWVTHWPDPKLALDGLDTWRCSVFRREPGAPLASELIRAAMLETARLWPSRPRQGWATWVDRAQVGENGSNPGYCFKMAGWWLDREWRPKSRKRGRDGRWQDLVRLRAAILEP
jgi:hypothetical protein